MSSELNLKEKVQLIKISGDFKRVIIINQKMIMKNIGKLLILIQINGLPIIRFK